MATELGLIFNIQRFSIFDGPGIRTTLFMKGCPLRCRWCHNPESWVAQPEIAYYSDKCVHCGACTAACPLGCHSHNPTGAHQFARAHCTQCANCVGACLHTALERVGYTLSPAQALQELRKDEAFYRNSGGGITLSGGEPFAQPAFALELLRLCKEAGLHTCVETCGATSPLVLEQAAPLVDLFLFDYKESDDAQHLAFTGVLGTKLHAQLALLHKLGAAVVLRCPIVPGLNDRPDHLAGIAAMCNRYANIRRAELEPYHPLGVSKSLAVGQPPQTQFSTPTKEEQQSWLQSVQALTAVPVALSS